MNGKPKSVVMAVQKSQTMDAKARASYLADCKDAMIGASNASKLNSSDRQQKYDEGMNWFI